LASTSTKAGTVQLSVRLRPVQSNPYARPVCNLESSGSDLTV
jgi:hypothetical protein